MNNKNLFLTILGIFFLFGSINVVAGFQKKETFSNKQPLGLTLQTQNTVQPNTETIQTVEKNSEVLKTKETKPSQSTPKPLGGLQDSSQKGEGESWMKGFLKEKPEYKNLPVVKLDRNSVHFQKPNGEVEANFSSGPINYQDIDGQWKPIDTTLRPNGNEITGNGTPAKIKPDGTVLMNNTSYSQKTTSFGWLDPAKGSLESTQQLLAGKIEGDKFVRETPEYKHVLTMLDNGLKEELTLFSIPQGGKEGNWLVLETKTTGLNLPDGWIDKEFKIGDNTFTLPTTKDARSFEAPTKRFAKKINGIQYIYTGIEYNWMKNAVYPITIDPDFTESTNDGYVYGAHASSYSTARSTSGGFQAGLNFLVVGQYYISEPQYGIYRGGLKFDTSSIGSANTVTQVNLKLTAITDNSVNDVDIQIVKHDWSGQDPLSAGNQEAFFDGNLAATLDDNIWRNTSGMSLDTQYTSGNLSTTWVNKTGNTYYGLRGSTDTDNSTPTVREDIQVASADHATSGYRPVLTVTYTPSTSNIRFDGLKMEGVQIK